MGPGGPETPSDLRKRRCEPGHRETDLRFGSGLRNLLFVARERRDARSRDRAAGPEAAPSPLHSIEVLRHVRDAEVGSEACGDPSGRTV
jgi:hypothetical protein